MLQSFSGPLSLDLNQNLIRNNLENAVGLSWTTSINIQLEIHQKMNQSFLGSLSLDLN